MGCFSGGGEKAQQTANWTPEQQAAMAEYFKTVQPYAMQGGQLQQGPQYTGQQYLPGTPGQAATAGYWSGGRRRGEWTPGQPAVAAQPGQAISDILPSYLAQMNPQYAQMGNQALQNLSGGMEEVFAPIYQQSQNLWNQQIAPGVMERFAGMGNALSGGAASALSREGQNLSTNLGATLAPMWLQNQQALPGLAQEMGGWEQATRQQPLDVSRQLWESAQPYRNPYLNMFQASLPTGAAYSTAVTGQQAGLGYSGLTSFLGGYGSSRK